MSVRRVALIGHSGAGKSSCLVALGFDRNAADMDVVLGTKQSPSLSRALNWLASDSAPPMVVVSNHERLLLEMQLARLTGQHVERFTEVCFVYLHKPKDELQAHLTLPSAGGRFRDHASQRYTLDNYERFAALFANLADHTVDCSGRTIDEVAAMLVELTQPSEQRRAGSADAADGGRM